MQVNPLLASDACSGTAGEQHGGDVGRGGQQTTSRTTLHEDLLVEAVISGATGCVITWVINGRALASHGAVTETASPATAGESAADYYMNY
jgi:hypothetical protein